MYWDLSAGWSVHCCVTVDQVEGQPFSVVTAPAHRALPGQASTEDGSLQVIFL